jgi:hypothetical protein
LAAPDGRGETGAPPRPGWIDETVSFCGAGGRTLDAQIRYAVRIALANRTTDVPELQKALSSLAILRALNTHSSFGREWDPVLHRNDAVEIVEATIALSDPMDTLEAAVLELRRTGLIVVCQAGAF